MEATPDAKVEINSSDKGKKKRNWWDAFFTFLAYGGILVLLAVGFAIYVVITLLIK